MLHSRNHSQGARASGLMRLILNRIVTNEPAVSTQNNGRETHAANSRESVRRTELRVA
jgi:hypothetical protein